MHFCLTIDQFVKNQTMSVQFGRLRCSVCALKYFVCFVHVGLVTAFVAVIVYMLVVGLTTLSCWLYNKRFAASHYYFFLLSMHAIGPDIFSS